MIEIDVPELIKALRSGEFKQGFGHLNKDDSYCCLGVACQLLTDKSQVSKTFEEISDKWLFTVIGNEGVSGAINGSFLPYGVKFPDSMGLRTSLCNFWNFPDDRDGCMTSLVSLNDDGVPFEHIADFLQYFHDNPIEVKLND